MKFDFAAFYSMFEQRRRSGLIFKPICKHYHSRYGKLHLLLSGSAPPYLQSWPKLKEHDTAFTVISYIHTPPHSMLVMTTLIAKNAVEEYENQPNIEWGSGARNRCIRHEF